MYIAVIDVLYYIFRFILDVDVTLVWYYQLLLKIVLIRRKNDCNWVKVNFGNTMHFGIRPSLSYKYQSEINKEQEPANNKVLLISHNNLHF